MWSRKTSNPHPRATHARTHAFVPECTPAPTHMQAHMSLLFFYFFVSLTTSSIPVFGVMSDWNANHPHLFLDRSPLVFFLGGGFCFVCLGPRVLGYQGLFLSSRAISSNWKPRFKSQDAVAHTCSLTLRSWSKSLVSSRPAWATQWG